MLHLVRSRWFGFAMGIICALALVIALGSVTGVWAGGLAQGGQPLAGPTSPDATLGDAIPIQGRLTDSSGNPLNGTYGVTFKIYSAATGGTALCTSTYTGVNALVVSNGLFSTSITGCADATIDGSQLYLGITVGTDPEMTPRQQIGSVPFARSLRPGANIRGTGGSYILQVAQMNTSGAALDGVASNIAGSAVGVTGIAVSPDGYGGYFANVGSTTGSGGALYAQGDVKQIREGDGLVKAAVYAQCSTSGSAITRSFNNVTGTITISNGASAGQCTIDFGFDVSDRYVAATAPGTVARIVTTAGGTTNARLNIYRWDTAGAGTSGPIMVVVY